VGDRVHRHAPRRSAVGVDHGALAGANAGRRVHRSAPVGVKVSRQGRWCGPLRRGCAWSRSSCAPSFSRPGRWCHPGRRGCVWSCSSCSPVQPLGSIMPHCAARMRVVVLIASSGSGLRRPVGVHAHAGAGADARARVHRVLRSAVGVDHPAVAGVDARADAHRELLQPLGSMPQPLPAGSCVVVFIVCPPSAVGVDAGAMAGADACVRAHRAARVRASVRRWGPSPRLRRRAASWWCSSCRSAQPLGLIIPPSPARVWVAVLICVLLFSRWDPWLRRPRRGPACVRSWGAPVVAARQPLGSMVARLPARTWDRVLIRCSGCVARQPLGSMVALPPARTCERVFMGCVPVGG
jgi:hypothetical protein